MRYNRDFIQAPVLAIRRWGLSRTNALCLSSVAHASIRALNSLSRPDRWRTPLDTFNASQSAPSPASGFPLPHPHFSSSEGLALWAPRHVESRAALASVNISVRACNAPFNARPHWRYEAQVKANVDRNGWPDELAPVLKIKQQVGDATVLRNPTCPGASAVTKDDTDRTSTIAMCLETRQTTDILIL